MASEIKIHLATYLKDAGIKASQQQIDKLAQQVKKANKEAAKSANELGGALGHLEGPIGKLQSAFGGLAAKGLAVFAALKTGIDIGNWIQDKVIAPLLGIKDPIEELKKHNREVEQSWQHAVDAFNESMAAWEQGWQKQVDGADKARQAIEDATAAYLRMQQAKEKVQDTKDTAELLGLKRDKFNAMAGAGSPEEAAAAGKYHDVLIAEAQQKQQLAKFDRDAETAAVKKASAEDALRKATDKRAALNRQMVELERKQAALAQQDVRKFGLDRTVQEEEKLAQKKASLQTKLDAATRDVNKRRAERDAVDVEMSANEQARANLQEQTQLEIDEKKKAFDDYYAYVEAQEAQAAQDEWQRQQEEIRKQVELEKAERTKMEQQLAQQRIDDLRSELAAEQSANSDARSRQSAAGSKLSQAWSWYRNQDQMQAVLDEKKAQAAAEAQWAKDFDRLKSRRRDWRTAEMGSLSAADESVRQVALAKEEKEAADKAVIETAENTRKLAEKVDELLQLKG